MFHNTNFPALTTRVPIDLTNEPESITPSTAKSEPLVSKILRTTGNAKNNTTQPTKKQKTTTPIAHSNQAITQSIKPKPPSMLTTPDTNKLLSTQPHQPTPTDETHLNKQPSPPPCSAASKTEAQQRTTTTGTPQPHTVEIQTTKAQRIHSPIIFSSDETDVDTVPTTQPAMNPHRSTRILLEPQQYPVKVMKELRHRLIVQPHLRRHRFVIILDEYCYQVDWTNSRPMRVTRFSATPK